MSEITSEDRAAIRDSFERLLVEHGTEADVRRAMACDTGYDQGLWDKMAELGLMGLIIDPDHGGIGGGPVEVETVMEVAGAALLTSPYFSSAVLAVGLIGYAPDEAAKARLLPGIADGSRIVTLAMTGETGSWTPDGVTVTAQIHGNSVRLSGVASYVTAGSQADTFLVVAHGPAGLSVYEVAATADGVAIRPLETFDATTRMAKITLTEAEALPIDGADLRVIERTLNLARVALAGEQAAGARHVFDMTVDYIKSRVQFGRPVGGFQAMKHMAADLFLEVESAISAARHAARALAEDTAEADILISLAGFACADAFSEVAASAIQMHGGIGFTWDHPTHLYLRRARTDAQLFGNSDFYRDRYVTSLEKAA